MKKIVFVALILVFIDQFVKVLVKTTMPLGESIPVFSWFYIHFVENNGMAFGIEFGGDLGKFFLTLFRIIVVGLGIIYLYNLDKSSFPFGVFFCIGLILGGAISNIIDSVFYGIIFNDSYGQIASFLADSGGYAPIMFGKVVDMLYFPLFDGVLPNWIPFFGGDYFLFFRPVFNLADAGISTGIFLLILFYRNFFN